MEFGYNGQNSFLTNVVGASSEGEVAAFQEGWADFHRFVSGALSLLNLMGTSWWVRKNNSVLPLELLRDI